MRLMIFLVSCFLASCSDGFAALVGFRVGHTTSQNQNIRSFAIENLSTSGSDWNITAIKIDYTGTNAIFDTAAPQPPGVGYFTPFSMVPAGTFNNTVVFSFPNASSTDGAKVASMSVTGFTPGKQIGLVFDADDSVAGTNAVNVIGASVQVTFTNAVTSNNLKLMVTLASQTEAFDPAKVGSGPAFVYSGSVITPEPSTALIAIGLAGMCAIRRRIGKKPCR